MPDITVRTQYNLLLEITEVVWVAETSRGTGRIATAHTRKNTIWSTRLQATHGLRSGKGCPRASDGKESACNPRDLGLIPRLGRSSGEGKGSSILAWRIPWTAKNQIQLSNFHFQATKACEQ